MTDRSRSDDGLEPPADATAIRDEQVDQALRRLGGSENLTPRQRATVERLADRLTAELLGMFDADEQTPEGADIEGGEPRVPVCQAND